MKIELEVLCDDSLSIAQAILNRTMGTTNTEFELAVAREKVRTIGQALVNHAEALDRIDARWK